MYIQLNKRLAFNQQINVESQTQLLLAWLLNLYDKHRLSKMKVISFKIALTTMCAGKLIDKLKCMPIISFFLHQLSTIQTISFFFLDVFTQISDSSKNNLIIHKLESYLKELLVLPKSVFEEPSFGYTENLAKTCFDLVTIFQLVFITPKVWLKIFYNIDCSDKVRRFFERGIVRLCASMLHLAKYIS
jgi:hypothetical protein